MAKQLNCTVPYALLIEKYDFFCSVFASKCLFLIEPLAYVRTTLREIDFWENNIDKNLKNCHKTATHIGHVILRTFATKSNFWVCNRRTLR